MGCVRDKGSASKTPKCATRTLQPKPKALANMQPQRRGRGRPPKKRRKVKQGGQSSAPSPSICSADPSDGAEVVDVDEEPITGDPRKWDPHVGTKPSELDDCGSDGEVELEDELPDGGDVKVNGPMVDMMVNLGEWDARDLEWLPPNEQRKLAARKQGIVISVQANILTILTSVQGKGRPIHMGPMLPQNQNEHSDAPNMFEH